MLYCQELINILYICFGVYYRQIRYIIIVQNGKFYKLLEKINQKWYNKLICAGMHRKRLF